MSNQSSQQNILLFAAGERASVRRVHCAYTSSNVFDRRICYSVEGGAKTREYRRYTEGDFDLLWIVSGKLKGGYLIPAKILFAERRGAKIYLGQFRDYRIDLRPQVDKGRK